MTIRYNKSKTKGDKNMKLKIYNEGGKVRVTKADLDGSETTLFSGLSDGGSAVIDVSSAVSLTLIIQ